MTGHTADPAPTTDRLQITTARLVLTNGLAMILGVILLVALAWPIAALARGGLSTGALVAAIVFIPVLAGGGAMMLRLGYTQIVRARIRLPVLEATSDRLRMRDAAGREFEVKRAEIDYVVWLYIGNSSVGRRPPAYLEIHEKEGNRVHHWDVGVTAGRAAVPWLQNLGIPVKKDVTP